MTKIGCSNCTSTEPGNPAVKQPASGSKCRFTNAGSVSLPPISSCGPQTESDRLRCKEQCKPLADVEIPKYAFLYPNFDRIKLATIKDSIYHPRIPAVPSLRRIDRDDQMCKLADEHVKTSVPCGKEFYERSLDPDVETPPGVETVIRKEAPHPSIYDPDLVILCPEIKEGRAPPRNQSGDPTPSRVKVRFIRDPPKPKHFEATRYSKEEWRNFLAQDPSSYQLTPPNAPLSSELHWIGHGVTYLKLDNGDPTMKSRDKWRRSLKGIPNTTLVEGQRPIPSNTLNRFRRPALGKENSWWLPRVSSEPWKPQHYYHDNTQPMQHLTSGPPSRPFELDCERRKRVVYSRGLHTTN